MRSARHLFYVCAFIQPVFAALVVTEYGQVRGKIIRLEEKEVSVRLESGVVQAISKDKILTIHDDEGKLLWVHPSIVTEESNEKAQKLVLTPQRNPAWEFEATLGVGLMSSTTWFSTYPLGSKHDYRLLQEFNLTGLYPLDGSSYLTATLGYSERQMAANGVTIDGLYGVAVWPMRFIDVRAGYRVREDWLFVEVGLLKTFQLGTSAVVIDGTSRSNTLSDARATTGGYFGFYFGLGAILQLYRALEGVFILRYDHGLSSAIDSQITTQSAPDGSSVSTAPLRLVPWSVAGHIGLRYSFR